jgi:hypothetical protein
MNQKSLSKFFQSSPLYGWIAIGIVVVFLLVVRSSSQTPAIPTKSEFFVPEQYSFYFLRPRAERSKTEVWKYDHGTQKKIRVLPWLVDAQLSPNQQYLAGIPQSQTGERSKLKIWNLTSRFGMPMDIPISEPTQMFTWSQDSHVLLYTTGANEIGYFNMENGNEHFSDSSIFPPDRRVAVEILGQWKNKTIFQLQDVQDAKKDQFIQYDRDRGDIRPLFQEDRVPLGIRFGSETEQIIGLFENNLIVTDLDGTVVTSIDLPINPGAMMSPLSPNGRYIVITAAQQPSSVQSSLVLVDLEQNKEIPLEGPQGIDLRHSTWTPDSRALFLDSEDDIFTLSPLSQTLTPVAHSAFSLQPFPIQTMSECLGFLEE